MGWWLESCARKLEPGRGRPGGDQELVIERSHWVRVAGVGVKARRVIEGSHWVRVAGVGVKVTNARRDDVGGRTCR